MPPIVTSGGRHVTDENAQPPGNDAGPPGVITDVRALIVLALGFGHPQEAAPPAVRVAAEETVAACGDPKNGAGWTWCYGAPLITRAGDRVFASVMEVGEGVAPLCNTRPRVFERGPDGWKLLWTPREFLEREPAPIAAARDGRLFVSINPLLDPSKSRQGPSRPHVLRLLPGNPAELAPSWPAGSRFSEHSYRGLAVDRARGDLLLLNQDVADLDRTAWAYLDSSGAGTRSGGIRFPIRACYPQVFLRDRAACVLAIGDIVEPVEDWRKHKFEKTQRKWDYVFRRLFLSWTPDLEKKEFSPPAEIETVEATGGHIQNLDLWLDARGGAHALYIVRNSTPILRDRYFPGLKLRQSLVHAVIRDGAVTSRETLAEGGEGFPDGGPAWARFHAAPGGRLFVLATVAGKLLVRRVLPSRSAAAEAPLKEPLGLFFTATERGGTEPSTTVDVLGAASKDYGTIRYARLLLDP